MQRITAALLVDDEVVRTEQKGKVSFTRRKRSQDELNKIQALAEAVIGFDAKRGDTISVQNLSFNTDPANLEPAAANWATKAQKTVTDFSSVLRPLSILMLFVLAYFFILRPIQKHALSSGSTLVAESPALTASDLDSLPAPTPELSSDAIRAARLREQAAEMIRQKPVHTARAVQAWLSEETS